jgi:hypothetical protein
MRVIFDRSSFHGDRFQALVNSPLRSLARSRQLIVLLTPVFIAETLDQYGSEQNAGTMWREHLKFAAEICNGGIFLTTFEIWHNELVSGRGASARYLFPERRTRRYDESAADMLARLIAIANTGDLDRQWRAGAARREDVHHKKDQQRAHYARVRAEVSDALRSNSYAHSRWEDYLRSQFLNVGRGLMKRVHGSRQSELGDMWAQAPWRYPFYSAFVQGFMYALYNAGERHNDKIDRNAQADYEQLAFLTRADAIVSDDLSFMRHSFDTLWAQDGKRFFTARQFADFTSAIQHGTGLVRH